MPSQNSSGSMVMISPVGALAITRSPHAPGLCLSLPTACKLRHLSRSAMLFRKSRSTSGSATSPWRTVLSASSTTRTASSISPRVLHSMRTVMATSLLFGNTHLRKAEQVPCSRLPKATLLPLSISPWPGHEPRGQGRPGFPAGALEKGGDDLLKEDILVQEDRAFGDFPPGHGVAPQHIIPLTHEEVHLIVQPVGVDNKAARHLHFVALHVDDAHVGHDVTDARYRLLAPVNAGVDLADAPGQDSPVFVDPGDL